MSSMYAKYLKENRNDQIIETSKGFATYRYVNNDRSVYVVDIYVLPEYREEHVASEMANEIARIAKSRGIEEMLGSVVPSANNSTTSLKVLLSYGMTLQSSSNDFIVFRKAL